MTAKVAVFHGSGLPITLAETSIPNLREGETLVRIHCCALCRSDLHTHSGRRIEPTPTILGHEAVGSVIESRAGFSEGQRVTWSLFAACGECFFCHQDLPQKCESLFKYGHTQLTDDQPLSGGLATHILLRNGTQMIPLPDDLSDEIAVLANCSTATAFASIRHAELRPYSVVAILGLGILGLSTAAILNSMGHQVIAYDPDSGKAEAAIRFGCTRFSTDPVEFQEIIKQTTQNRGADACVELAGSQAAAQLSLECIRIGGTAVWTGAAAPIGEIPIQPERILKRQLTIRGVHNYAAADLIEAVRFLSEQSQPYPCHTLIGQQLALDQIQVAFSAAATSPSRILVYPN